MNQKEMLVELIKEDRASLRCVIVGELQLQAKKLVYNERESIKVQELKVTRLEREIKALKGEIYDQHRYVDQILRNACLKDFIEKVCQSKLHPRLIVFDADTRTEIKEVLIRDISRKSIRKKE